MSDADAEQEASRVSQVVTTPVATRKVVVRARIGSTKDNSAAGEPPTHTAP